MPEAMPDGTVFFRHDADEVDTDPLIRDAMPPDVEHHTSFEDTSLIRRECIEWMRVRLIETVAYFHEYRDSPIPCDDIYLTALDRIVHLDDLISLALEVFSSDLLSSISDGATRWSWYSHREVKGEFSQSEKIVSIPLVGRSPPGG